MADKYKKHKGSAGLEGVQFQLDLLTVALVNALHNHQKWKISTENKEAGKYDDIVIELSDESAVLVQCKHKGSKKITKDQLFSHSSKNADFSLPKYFLSYEEIKRKFKERTVIVCTNAAINLKGLENTLTSQDAGIDSTFYYEGCSFFTFSENILPDLKRSAQRYLKENLQSRCIDKTAITDESLKEFLRNLQFFSSYPSGEDLHKIIEQRLSDFDHSNLWCKISYDEIYRKIEDWFKQPKGEYLTELRVKAILCEMRSDKYSKSLRDYKVSFERNNFDFTDSNKVVHVNVGAGYLLQTLNIFHKLEDVKERKLYVGPDDDIDALTQIIETFELRRYAILIINWSKDMDEAVVKEISIKLRTILQERQCKKVILVGNNRLVQHIGLKDTFQVNESVTFLDLTKECQNMLLKRKNIVFQGETTNLEELLLIHKVEEITKLLDSDTLEKLIKSEAVEVGVRLLDLDKTTSRYYINRTFERKFNRRERREDMFLEENIFDVNEKMVLITDTAGTGKTTVLTRLSVAIKEKNPRLWIIRVNLNDYTKVLRDSQKQNERSINIIDFLDSQEATRLTQFERSVFSMDKKVVLVLDGVDEVSPDHTSLILGLLIECQEAPNFAKIIVTTRPHVSKELEAVLKVTPFRMLSFTQQDQIDFLTRYWASNLSSESDAGKDKCEWYAKTLIAKVSTWIKAYDHQSSLAAIPLQAKMLGEIFEENIRRDETVLRLPEKFDITKLYDMFIEKKREIFIGKGNTGGNTLSELAIKDQFEMCLAYHRNLALEVILTEADTDLFSNCCRSDKDMETYLLKIGIVYKSDEEYQFIHRTFAEYFVAQSVLREIHLENQNVLFHRFVVDELLLKPEFEVIRAFFDSLLRNCNLNYNLFENYLSFTYESSLRYWKCNENLIFVLSGEGHVAILHLILKSIQFKATGGQEINIKHWRVNRKNMNTLRYLRSLVREGGVNIRDENGYMPLHRAVMGCQFEMVKFLVEQGANVDGKDEERNTGLILAASEGCLDIINLLLRHGAAINITNNDGCTALHEAVECGYLDIVKHLVGSDADCNIKDNYGRTVLHLAAQRGHLDVVEYLLGLGADFDVRDNDDSTVLHLACARGCLDTVKYFVGLNADVNAKDKNGHTLLHVASECGYLEIVEYLTKHVDYNIRDNEGHTALHLAVMKGYLEIVKYLKKNDQDFGINDNKGRTSLHLAAANDFLEIASEIGGEVNVTDNNGCTPLHLAAGKGYMDIVQYLVEGGADINAKDNEGRTVLHSACLTNKLDCIKYLMERGADGHTRDNRGCTVLHLAAADGYLDTIMFLVGLGVDFNIKDDNGRTAVHFAALKGKLRTVKYLVGLGVDLNIKDNDGQSALHYAILNDTLDTAKYLTEQGVDPNIKNNHSRTPLHIAALYGKLDAVKYLMQIGADPNIKDENGKTAFDYVDNGDFVKFIMELDMKSNNLGTVEVPIIFEIDVTEEDNVMNIDELVTNLDTVKHSDINESELYSLEVPVHLHNRNVHVAPSDELNIAVDGNAEDNIQHTVINESELDSLELNVDSTENLSNRNLHAEGNGELDTIKNAIELPEHSLDDNITCNDNSTIPNLSAHNNDLNTVKHSNINEVELNPIERPHAERGVDLHNNAFQMVLNDEFNISKNVIEQAVDIISGYNIKGSDNSTIPNLTAQKVGLDTVENFIEHAAGLNNRDNIPTNNNGSTLSSSATVKGIHDSTMPNLTSLNGDLDTVKNLDINESELLDSLELSVERTENLNNQDLHTGRNGELDTIKDVIKHVVDVNDDNTIQGNDDFTTTNLIVRDSDLDTVKHSGKNKDGLASVALNDELNTIRNVGENSRDYIPTAFHSFAQDNDDSVVSNLSAQIDDLEIVKQLAEHDVDDIISNDDHTASHLSAEEGDLDKQSIEKGSKVKIKDNQGRTTLQSGTGQSNPKNTRCPLCKII